MPGSKEENVDTDSLRTSKRRDANKQKGSSRIIGPTEIVTTIIFLIGQFPVERIRMKCIHFLSIVHTILRMNLKRM
jgi:hypothetical protein